VTALPSASVLVRTWFSDDSAWESLVSDVETANDEGFLANVVPGEQPSLRGGLSAPALKAKQPGGAIVSFIADEMTLTNGERPILAVWVLPRQAGDERDGNLQRARHLLRLTGRGLPTGWRNAELDSAYVVPSCAVILGP
jgi:hypothetical protein